MKKTQQTGTQKVSGKAAILRKIVARAFKGKTAKMDNTHLSLAYSVDPA